MSKSPTIPLTAEAFDDITLGDVDFIFDPNTGRSFNPTAPAFVNTLDRLASGAYWVNAGPGGAFLFDLYWPGFQTVDVSGSGFHAFPYTGPTARFDADQGDFIPLDFGPERIGGFVFEDVPNGSSIFARRAGDWISFNKGAPAFVQSLTQLRHGTGLIGRFDGPASFVLPLAGAAVRDCDIFFTPEETLINPDALAGPQTTLDKLNELSGGEFSIGNFAGFSVEVDVDVGCLSRGAFFAGG